MRILLYITIAIIGACNYSDKKTATSDPKEIESKQKDKEHCYAWFSNKDTIYLSVFQNGNLANGKLDYLFFEKDSNRGTYKGEFRGDTLIAEYEFNSEGTKSIRQVAFIKKENGMIEGYGEYEEKEGKMVFKNTSSLIFGTTALNKVDCRQ